jgi:hypothetical protein
MALDPISTGCFQMVAPFNYSARGPCTLWPNVRISQMVARCSGNTLALGMVKVCHSINFFVALKFIRIVLMFRVLES